jgi:hypothetical protein
MIIGCLLEVGSEMNAFSKFLTLINQLGSLIEAKLPFAS